MLSHETSSRVTVLDLCLRLSVFLFISQQKEVLRTVYTGVPSTEVFLRYTGCIREYNEHGA